MLYIGCVLFIKLSICLFIKRLVGPSSKGLILITNIMISFFIFITTLSFFMIFFSCRPVAAVWDVTIRVNGNYTCINQTDLIRSLNIVYAIGDIWLLALPIFIVLRLRLSAKRRFGVCCIFAVGGVACASAIARLWYIPGAYSSFDPSCKILYERIS
jgi:hypothetical protein